MTENNEPPSLFDNVDIFDKEDDNDDLFASAVDDIGALHDENSHPPEPLLTELPKLQLNFDKDEQPAPTPSEEYDSDEVKLQSPQPAVRKTAQEIAEEEAKKEGGDQFLEIKVSESNRVGDGMGAYVAFKVDVHTNIPLFKKKKFTVHRRFSDFLDLADSREGVQSKLRLLQLLPRSRGKRLLNQWQHPASLMVRARQHSQNILSGVEGAQARGHPQRTRNQVISRGLAAFPSEDRLSPLDTFLDLLTAKANLAELDFNLLIAATTASTEEFDY